MPPRSATRKKSTWKSKQSELELSLADQINTVPESEHKGQEALSAVVKDEGGEQAAPLMIAGVEIKQELRVLDSNYADKAVMSTAVETKVKEEERNVNVNPVSFMEDGERMQGDHDKFDNAAEEKEVEGEQNEGIHVEQNSSEEGTAAAQIDDAEAFVDNDNFPVLNERSDGQEGGEVGGKDEEDIGDNEEDNEDEEQPAEFINNHITDRKKKKDFEIFIGRLDKGAVEDDLIEVFGKFGEIKAARIVRNPTTNKSRGFAFIQYVTVEQAKNALSALNEGIQVRGKHVVISASQDNDTLYMGNICKLWTKEHVLGTLKSYGVENIEEIYLPDDPQKEGKIKGFALLEFSTYSDAMAAFQRLRKPDAVFGRDRSAKVAFAQTPMHPNQEILSQVKTVYVEGLTDAGNKEKVKEICTQYGEVVKVQLPQSLGSKRKYFGFITFTSRESALACVEGINNAHIGQEVKVKANIAKPHFKGRLQKQGTRGGFKVKKKSEVPSMKEETERENIAAPSKMKGHAKSKRAKKKGKMLTEEGNAISETEIGGGKPNKPKTVTEGQPVRASSKLERTNRKRKNQRLKAKGHGKIGAEHGHNEMPSKKRHSKMRGRQNNNFKKTERDPHIRKGPNYCADFIEYRNPYAPGYVAPAVSCQSHAYNTVSGSKRSHADMEPHAGYIDPVARKQSRSFSGYLEPTVGMRYQPHVGHLESVVGTQSQPHRGYHVPAVGNHSISSAGYLEPTLGTRGQPHAGYLEPAVGRQSQSHAAYFEWSVGKHSHNPYDVALRRMVAVEHNYLNGPTGILLKDRER
ncbi:hypothetical protein HYC85_001089 [Camellia sinensis]|uniref:RRM domain-containing protein n=1 Tax=Camellia sinensis TaxID=4442 RepID=A0A7J7I4E2_CAMSI|nr:hypothetical protein HYC85_001089 [Camellia sinensis]